MKQRPKQKLRQEGSRVKEGSRQERSRVIKTYPLVQVSYIFEMFRLRLMIKWTTDCLLSTSQTVNRKDEQLPLLLQQKRLHFQSQVFRNFFKRTRSYFIVGFETSFIQILFLLFFSFIYSNRFLPSLSTT